MIDWRRVPWPLWAYSAVMLLGTILVEVKAHGPIPANALLAAVMLALLYLLLKGVRWVWIVTLGIYVLGPVPEVISGSLEWQGVALSLIGLMLLLLPVTRRYFSSHTAAGALHQSGARGH
jgi:membrane protein implicated in regulation of membrane protease activity